jgi:LPXTG-motif cell wall-anchored protein
MLAEEESLAWIAGPVVGGVVGLLLIAGVAWWLYRRREGMSIVPFKG